MDPVREGLYETDIYSGKTFQTNKLKRSLSRKPLKNININIQDTQGHKNGALLHSSGFFSTFLIENNECHCSLHCKRMLHNNEIRESKK